MKKSNGSDKFVPLWEAFWRPQNIYKLDMSYLPAYFVYVGPKPNTYICGLKPISSWVIG